MMVDPDKAPVFVKLKLAKDGKKLARLAIHIGSLDETRGPVGDRFLAAVRKAVEPEHGKIVRTWYLGGFHGNPGHGESGHKPGSYFRRRIRNGRGATTEVRPGGCRR